MGSRCATARAAAEQQSAAFSADYAYARQSLAATVAKSWFLAIEAGLQQQIAEEALRSSQSLPGLAGAFSHRQRQRAVGRAGAGLGGSYRDSLQQTELARTQALRALELLVGRYPAAEIAVATRLSPSPSPVPVGMPSELLERRPDVVAAERRVAAAFNRVGEARAAQLPRISLTAGGSSVSSDLIVLKDTSNPIWSFGGNLSRRCIRAVRCAPRSRSARRSRSRRSPSTRARRSVHSAKSKARSPPRRRFAIVT